MKRIVAMTVVLFVLSLGGLAMMTLFMCRAQDRVEFSTVVTRGDPAAARGLHMTEYDMLASRVRWTTEHDLGAQTQETTSVFSGKEIPYDGSGRTYGSNSICTLVPDTERVRAYLRQQSQDSRDSNVLLHPADFVETYDLCLDYGGSWQAVTADDRRNDPSIRDFPLMHIPVGAEDAMELYIYENGGQMRYSINYAFMANDYESWDADVKAGTVVTAGFDAGVDAKAEWAPEGFGLWLVEWGAQSEQNIRLVYPLNIETQRVVKLIASPDREKLLLFTAEGEDLTLRVIAGEDFRLLQTVPLGKIGIEEAEETYFSSNGEEQTTHKKQYETVRVCSGDGFYAVAVGKRLTVLQEEESGLERVFSCYMIDLYVISTADGERCVWEDQGAEIDQCIGVCTPVDGGWYYDFEGISMVLRDGRLAMAWTDRALGDGNVMVEIYSGDGLVYAREIGCGLYRQNRSGTQTLQDMTKPTLVWEAT